MKPYGMVTALKSTPHFSTQRNHEKNLTGGGSHVAPRLRLREHRVTHIRSNLSNL